VQTCVLSLPVDTPVFLEVFFQVFQPGGRVVAQLTVLNDRHVFDVVYEQVPIAVSFLLKFAVADVTLVDDGGSANLSGALKLGKVFLT